MEQVQRTLSIHSVEFLWKSLVWEDSSWNSCTQDFHSDPAARSTFREAMQSYDRIQ
jgi:hypothetical protein